MDFLGIGPGELLIIIIVALLVFGPEKMADVGKTAGKAIRDFKKAASDLTTQVNRELEETKSALKVDDLEESAAAPPATEVKPAGIVSASEKDASPATNGDQVTH